MKIIYLIAGTRHSGGMERVLANKANWLVEHGHEVCIVTTDQEGEEPFFKLDERITSYDLAIGYEENNGGGFLNKLIHYPFKQHQHRRKLEALLKELKADVVVSMFCNDASFLPKIKDGSKKVLEIHFSRFKLLQYGRKGLWALADRWRSANYEKIARRFDRFVVLTEEDKQYWDGLDNIMVIPNARTFTCEKPAQLENKEVLAVGRYNYQKGYDRLLDTWAIVHREMPDWKLRILGDGELRHELEQQAAEQLISDSVIFGRAEHNVKDIYQQASVYAMTSRYEGLPMVLLEAQAAGLPIVSFDCKCGPKDVIEDGQNGFIVKDGDIQTFTQKLLLMMQDNKLRKDMGQKAFEDSERFDEERVMEQWTRLFNDVLKEG